MNSDIRIETDFLRHPKRLRLQQELGAAGLVALYDLWLNAALTNPEGVLEGWTAEMIEHLVNWRGEPGLLVQTFLDLALLDQTTNGYSIHNWSDRQTYAAAARKRIEQARNAAHVRWDKGDGDEA